VVVEAVFSEPVSERITLIGGKIQGIFANQVDSDPFRAGYLTGKWSFFLKFPKPYNREFFALNREFPHDIRESHRRFRECLAVGSNPGPATTFTEQICTTVNEEFFPLISGSKVRILSGVPIYSSG
jgi:hypothetical protein